MGHGIAGHARAGRLDRTTAAAVAQCLQALSSSSRLLILGRLREGPCSVGALAEAVAMEQSAVSHQLRTLRHLGLVVSERRGRQVYYGLHDSHVAELLDQALFHVDHLRLAAAEPLDLATPTAS